MIHNKKIVFLMFVLLIQFIITGCWDKVDIDKRNFVLTVGIDKNMTSNDNSLIVTFGFPNLKSYISTPLGGGGKGQPKFTVTDTGNSIFDIAKQIENRISGVMYFGCTEAVILGENLINDPKLVRQVFGELERSHELNRMVNVVCVKGSVENAIKVSPQYEPITGLLISKIFNNRTFTSTIITGDIGKMEERLLNTNGDAVIPLMSYDENNININGAVILKRYKMVGTLNNTDNTSLNILDNKVKGGSIVVDKDGASIPIEIYDVRTTKRITLKNGKISLIVNTTLEGDMSGNILGNSNQDKNYKFIKTVENLAEQKLDAEMKSTINKIIAYKSDVIGAGDLMSKYEPDEWDKISDKWDDEYFPKIRVIYNPRVYLRRIGSVD